MGRNWIGIVYSATDKTKIIVDDVKKGKVNNKLDKLRALRKRNGS